MNRSVISFPDALSLSEPCLYSTLHPSRSCRVEGAIARLNLAFVQFLFPHASIRVTRARGLFGDNRTEFGQLTAGAVDMTNFFYAFTSWYEF